MGDFNIQTNFDRRCMIQKLLMSKRYCFFLLITAFVLIRCLPPSEEKPTGVNVDFTNPAIQQLYDLQDKGLSDSLFPYFRHKDPTYRYLAALAFASIKDSLAVD